MVCYKGFNKDLTCTRGKGSFAYEVGKTFTADKAKCANSGLHCVEEPIEVLSWYSDKDSRYCMVDASGDINENDNKIICCTEMTLLKELTLEQIGTLECLWLSHHPERIASKHVHTDSYAGDEGDRIVIVRGKNPKASGCTGATLFLIREESRGNHITDIGTYRVDGKDIKPNVYYSVEGRRIRCAKKT